LTRGGEPVALVGQLVALELAGALAQRDLRGGRDRRGVLPVVPEALGGDGVVHRAGEDHVLTRGKVGLAQLDGELGPGRPARGRRACRGGVAAVGAGEDEADALDLTVGALRDGQLRGRGGPPLYPGRLP